MAHCGNVATTTFFRAERNKWQEQRKQTHIGMHPAHGRRQGRNRARQRLQGGGASTNLGGRAQRKRWTEFLPLKNNQKDAFRGL